MFGLAPHATESRQTAFGQIQPFQIACMNVCDGWFSARPLPDGMCSEADLVAKTAYDPK